ncbi:hypothetical protein ACKWTF_010748 [Chironomus riparius]
MALVQIFNDTLEGFNYIRSATYSLVCRALPELNVDSDFINFPQRSGLLLLLSSEHNYKLSRKQSNLALPRVLLTLSLLTLDQPLSICNVVYQVKIQRRERNFR